MSPTPRELRWMQHIARHGPLSTLHLHALTSDTHRCKDTALRQMQKLRAGGLLRLPQQQRAIERAEFNPYIYDLTKAGLDYLRNAQIDAPNLRPAGHWWHAALTASATSSIDMTAARTGIRYIPGHEILAIKNANLAIPLDRGMLIPDQLFALDYGGGFRAFAIEVDRGTEPKTSRTRRKSYAQSLQRYRQVLERRLHRSHYGLTANLLVLWVFTQRTDADRFLELAAALPTQIARCVHVRVAAVCRPFVVDAGLFEGDWVSEDSTKLRICDR